MATLLAISVVCGLLCGFWVWLSGFTALSAFFVGWIGFGGYTAFFASGESGMKGVTTAIPAVISGSLWALLALWIPEKFNISIMPIIMSTIIGFTMCYQSKIRFFRFIPGAFIGSFTTFGALSMGLAVPGADYPRVLCSLIVGVFLGISNQKIAELISKKREA